MTNIATTLTGFSGTVLRPGDDGYDRARQVWNGAVDRRPAFIARCAGTADVVAAVRFGVRHGLPIAVRGGGHSIPGHSVCEGGLLIDLSPLRSVEVDRSARVARVGPGVLWGQLDAAAEAEGLAVPGGEISHTGVGGLTLGGGIGWLSRKYGLSCDNLLGAEVVTAAGEVLAVTEDQNPDLLWGLRGGGGNFGVVTTFMFRLHPIPVPLFAGMAMHPFEDGRAALDRFFRLAADAPDELGLNAAVVTAPPAPFVPSALHGKRVVVLAASWLGPADAGPARVAPLREGALLDTFGPMPYTALQSMVDAAVPHGLPAHARSEWLRPLPAEGIDALLDVAARMTSPLSQCLVRVMGGAISAVPPADTAFRFRDAAAMLTLAALWPDRADDREPHRRWARTGWSALRPWSAGGGYVNHLGDEGADRLRQAYGEATWRRLVDLKKRYDPANVFHHNQNIPPNGR